MSLDVSLTLESGSGSCTCHCGHEHDAAKPVKVFEANITHNLNRMAGECGVYDCVWRPEENGFHKGKDLIDPLEKGIAALKADPKKFEVFNAKNGWGTYEQFLPWLERYLEACKQNPEAGVLAFR